MNNAGSRSSSINAARTSSALSGVSHSGSRSVTSKRDTLMAELERDPQHSSAKRQQRSQAFTSTVARASLERQLLTAQTAKAEAEAKLRERESYIERLEQDRRFLAEREQAEREEKVRERASSVQEKSRAEEDLLTLRNALATLRQEQIEIQEENAKLKSSCARQLSTSQNTPNSILTRRNAELEQELTRYKAVVKEKETSVQVLQQKVDQFEAAGDVAQKGSEKDKDWGVIKDELHRQASYMRSLESTNARLSAELTRYKDRYSNIEILREEKLALERKVSVTQELRERVVTLEGQVEAARREQQEMARTIEASPSAKPALTVIQNLSELRLTHARLLEEHGSTIALLRTREAEQRRAETALSEAQSIITALKAEVHSLEDTKTRWEQQAKLAEREVGGLKALVTSYATEERTSDKPPPDASLVERAQQLERSLDEYKSFNSQLHATLDAVQAEDRADATRIPYKELKEQMEYHEAAAAKATKALEQARTVIKTHEDSVDKLEQELFELGGRIAAGQHIPPGTRVLCFQDNPAQQWTDLRQSAMDRLKSENAALIKRLKDLEGSGAMARPETSAASQAVELVPRESWEALEKEKKELEEVVKQKEKRLLRLQQIFSAKSSEFRETITSILGFKPAFYQNGQVRVTSIYDLSASFVFQPVDGDGARMQLIAEGEGGPQDLPQLKDYWVGEEQCIPGFLASVTLECYDRSKREGDRLNGT